MKLESWACPLRGAALLGRSLTTLSHSSGSTVVPHCQSLENNHRMINFSVLKFSASFIIEMLTCIVFVARNQILLCSLAVGFRGSSLAKTPNVTY